MYMDDLHVIYVQNVGHSPEIDTSAPLARVCLLRVSLEHKVNLVDCWFRGGKVVPRQGSEYWVWAEHHYHCLHTQKKKKLKPNDGRITVALIWTPDQHPCTWTWLYRYIHVYIFIVLFIIANRTSLNWSHNGSKNYTVDSLSQNRCQRPLTNCHTAETAGKWWWKDDPWPRDFPDIYLSIKWFQDVTNVLFKRLEPLWIHYIRSCENYYVAMPSSSDLGATKTASTKTKSNSINRPATRITPPK